MTSMVTAQLTGKSQITIPKRVRETLKLRSKGDIVGFIIDEESHNVKLTRIEFVSSQEDFTDEEYKKLLSLVHDKKNISKKFRNTGEAIKYLKKL